MVSVQDFAQTFTSGTLFVLETLQCVVFAAMKKKHYFPYPGSVQLCSLSGMMSVH